MNVATALQLHSSWSYGIFSEKRYRPELGEYHTYGITVTGSGNMEVVHDVSTSRKTAERIMALLNRHQVSPVHFRDVITDLLSE